MLRDEIVKLSEQIEDLQEKMLNNVIDLISLDMLKNTNYTFFEVVNNYKDIKLGALKYYIRNHFRSEIQGYLDATGKWNPDRDWLCCFLEICNDYLI